MEITYTATLILVPRVLTQLQLHHNGYNSNVPSDTQDKCHDSREVHVAKKYRQGPWPRTGAGQSWGQDGDVQTLVHFFQGRPGPDLKGAINVARTSDLRTFVHTQQEEPWGQNHV